MRIPSFIRRFLVRLLPAVIVYRYLGRAAYFDKKIQANAAMLRRLKILRPICGCDIGTGWIPDVEECLRNMIAHGWDRDLQQVKQKFCNLRIYIGKSNIYIDTYITDAELRVGWRCEVCGSYDGIEREQMMGMKLCPKCQTVKR